MKPSYLLAAVFAVLAPSSGIAEVTTLFYEGAPKDRFEMRNTGACAVAEGRIVLDLSPAPAGLIFDTTAQGAGVEVFQPLDVVEGSDLIQAISVVGDGDNRVEIKHAELPVGAAIAFTIDLDDTSGAALGQIRVAGSEIAGAIVEVGLTDQKQRAEFTSEAKAVVKTPDCLS